MGKRARMTGEEQLTFPVEATPRERLVEMGPTALSDAELLALVVGRGMGHAEAMVLGQRILTRCGTARSLVGTSQSELCSIGGVGPSGAAALIAALELGRRSTRPRGTRRVVGCAADVAALCGEEMAAYDREHFRLVALDSKNRLILMEDVSVGSLSASLVHPRELFKTAVRNSAAGIVVVHNHPSGDVTPSRADIELTRRLAKAGDVLGIDLLDHVIVGDGSYASLKELNHI